MNEFNKQQAIDTLIEKAAIYPCHRCGNVKFAVLDGVSLLPLIECIDSHTIVDRMNTPIFHVLCENCGALTAHSLGMLDLMSNK